MDTIEGSCHGAPTVLRCRRQLYAHNLRHSGRNYTGERLRTDVSWNGFGYNSNHGDIAMPFHDWSRVPSGLFHDLEGQPRITLRDFVDKTVDCLRRGIHVLIVDLFPPTQRDPFGIHKVIWDEIIEEDFTFPTGKDRILVSYKTGGERQAYIEPVAVGDALPDMPLFLTNDLHVMVPLEPAYQASWDADSGGAAHCSRNGRATGARRGVNGSGPSSACPSLTSRRGIVEQRGEPRGPLARQIFSGDSGRGCRVQRLPFGQVTIADPYNVSALGRQYQGR